MVKTIRVCETFLSVEWQECQLSLVSVVYRDVNLQFHNE